MLNIPSISTFREYRLKSFFFFNVFIYRLYLFYMIMGQSKGSFFDDMLRGVYVFCMYNSFPICKL